MFGYINIPLKDDKGKPFYYNKTKVDKELNKLENYLENFPYIEEINNSREKIRNKNLLNADNYIINKEINKDTIRELYKIISDGILSKDEELNPGDYYRDTDVYIKNHKKELFDFESLNMLNYQKGPRKELIYDYMNDLIKYINTEDSLNKYLKSQIINLYIVYLQPYNNCNTRTASMLSKWYLKNNKQDKYLLFNDVIVNNKSEYNLLTNKSRNSNDLTDFLLFMIKRLKRELKKEEFIIKINKETKLTEEERIVIKYFFTRKDLTIQELIYIILMQINVEYSKVKNIILNLINKNIFVLTDNKKLKLNKSLILEEQKKL